MNLNESTDKIDLHIRHTMTESCAEADSHIDYFIPVGLFILERGLVWQTKLYSRRLQTVPNTHQKNIRQQKIAIIFIQNYLHLVRL